MALANIEIDEIEVGTRLRDISAAQVETLAASIGDIGLLNPITVYRRQIIQPGRDKDGYGLVAGAHRLEACKKLGLVDIAVQIVELSDLQRQIAECDENLCSAILSKADRAMFTKRRKQAYEALHPETKNGAVGVGRDKVRQVGEANPADRFTADTAQKTGQSERAVQRDAERGSKISEQALSMIKGTPLDTGKYLDSLKSTDQSEQAAMVKSDLEQRKKRKPVSREELIEKQVDNHRNAFRKMEPEAQEQIRKWHFEEFTGHPKLQVVK